MQEIIEARVRLAGELPSSFVKHLPGMEKVLMQRSVGRRGCKFATSVRGGTATLDAETLEWSR